MKHPVRVAIIAMLAVCTMFLTSTGSASAAPVALSATSITTLTPAPPPRLPVTAAQLAGVASVVDAQPATKALSKADRAGIIDLLAQVGASLAAHQKDQSPPPRTGNIPSMTIGLGWYIYFHHIEPSWQRWFLIVGVSTVAAVFCRWVPTSCFVAGIVAFTLVETISEFYTPYYCLEIAVTYSGWLHYVYPTRC